MNKQLQGRRAKRRGKAEERTALRFLTSFFGIAFWRNPDNGTKVADCESDEHVVEVKSRQRESYKLFQDAWSQAEAAHEQTGKDPWLLFSFVDNGKRTRWLIKKLEV